MSDGRYQLAKGTVLGFLLGVALVFSAHVIAGGFDRIAAGFGNIAKPDRIVSVRGLAEREVDSDQASMNVSYKVRSETLEDAHVQFKRRTAEVVGYLKSKGLTDADLVFHKPEIEFRKAYTSTETEYNEDGKRVSKKVNHPSVAMIDQSILVRTGNLKAIRDAYQQTIAFDGTDREFYVSSVNYDFVGLNDIKPEMIAEATKNAREAAEKFALDSNSAVGKIKGASQGWFSVDSAEEGMEHRKRIRVITSIDFYIVD